MIGETGEEIGSRGHQIPPIIQSNRVTECKCGSWCRTDRPEGRRGGRPGLSVKNYCKGQEQGSGASSENYFCKFSPSPANWRSGGWMVRVANWKGCLFTWLKVARYLLRNLGCFGIRLKVCLRGRLRRFHALKIAILLWFFRRFMWIRDTRLKRDWHGTRFFKILSFFVYKFVSKLTWFWHQAYLVVWKHLGFFWV